MAALTGVEVRTQPVRQKQRNPARLERELEVMKKSVGVLIFAATQVQGWNKFADRIDGEPQPSGFGNGSNPGVEFIELKNNGHQQTEITLMPKLGVSSRSL